MPTIFQNALGTYDNESWRMFAYTPSTDPAQYMELTDPTFAEMFSDWQGRAFWVISRTGTLADPAPVIEGNLTGNRAPFYVFLEQGWNLIALPWPQSTANPEAIQLQNIVVDSGDAAFRLTDPLNTVTQQGIWDYTGAGATGYVQMVSATDTMTPGKGYWLYVPTGTPKLLIPPDNDDVYFSLEIGAKKKGTEVKTKANVKALTPPPPPGRQLKAEGGNGCFVEALFSEL